MEKQFVTSQKIGTKQLAIIGMLSAICIVLGLTGYGFVQFPIAKATIMHIPVIIGAILEGPKVGALIGLMFGLFSIFQNIIAPNVLSFAFYNPLVSVMPRVLIGITSYYTYKYLSKKINMSIGAAFGAAVGSLTNTVGVLTMIYVIYAEKYAHAKNIAVNAVTKTIFSIAGINGGLESILAVLLVLPVVLAVKKIRK